MPPRATWVVGNWKQNLLRGPAAQCAAAIAGGLEDARAGADAGTVIAGIAPGYLALDAVRPYCGTSGLVLVAQDVAAQESGAFTGEVGPAMLAEAGVEAVIVGHSERRALYGDHLELVAAKLRAALAADLRAILCVGEAIEARDRGDHESVVISQLCAALAEVNPELPSDRLLIAYEPVWAIGTGRTATPDQADAMHARIRRWLRDELGSAFADRSLLYGGSVKPDNTADLIARPEIDGLLVGGASLDAHAFLAIVAAAAAATPP